MPNNFREEVEPLPRDAQKAFENYPFPCARDDFDARFWRELDNRKNRYRGFIGFWRRLVEVEIEGVAVWRLGLSLFGGAAFCGLGLALLTLRSHPASKTPTPQVAFSADAPIGTRRFARELWDDALPQPWSPPVRGQRQSIPKEVSCAWFKNSLA